MRPLVAAVTGLALLLSGCSAATPAPASASAAPADQAWLTRAGLAGLTAAQVVETLDRSATARPLAFKASVRPHEVLLEQAGQAVRLPLPDDRFYLSIAPYLAHTHDCFNHSLATCQGELVDTPAHVRIVDDAGTVLVNADTTTYANGFVGFWLPRDTAGTVEVTAAGKSGRVRFTTDADAPTCLTTLRLA